MVRRTISVLLAGMCLLAGCTGDPEPKIDDPTPSPTSAPTQTESADPQAAMTAFISGFVSELDESVSTGNPEPWLAMTDDGCANCLLVADNLRAAYADGGHIEGGKWTLKSATYVEPADLGEVWFVDIRTSRERWLDGDGQVVKVVDPGINRYVFYLASSADAWSLTDLRFR